MFEKYKIKKKMYFFSVNTKYMSPRDLKTSKYSIVIFFMFSTHSMKNIFGIHLKKVNTLYLLHGVISLPDATSCDKFRYFV